MHAVDSIPVLAEIRPRLEATFAFRLRQVVLYGSSARGDAVPLSDIDIMVVLDDPIQFGEDLRRTIEALYPIQLLVERPIHALPVSAAAFASDDFPLYREAKREGIAL